MAALGKIIGSVKTNAFAFGNGCTELHVHFLVYHSQHTFWGAEVHVRSWFCLVDICNSVANTTGRILCAKRSRELFSVWKREKIEKPRIFCAFGNVLKKKFVFGVLLFTINSIMYAF